MRKYIQKLSKKFEIEVHFDNEHCDPNQGACAGPDIYLGKFNNSEIMLSAFFHELGHIKIEQKYLDKWIFSKFMKELYCWITGLELAWGEGIVFSKDVYSYIFECLSSYIGYEEREIREWEKVKEQLFITSGLPQFNMKEIKQ